jgi:hypothetical protein
VADRRWRSVLGRHQWSITVCKPWRGKRQLMWGLRVWGHARRERKRAARMGWLGLGMRVMGLVEEEFGSAWTPVEEGRG